MATIHKQQVKFLLHVTFYICQVVSTSLIPALIKQFIAQSVRIKICAPKALRAGTRNTSTMANLLPTSVRAHIYSTPTQSSTWFCRVVRSRYALLHSGQCRIDGTNSCSSGSGCGGFAPTRLGPGVSVGGSGTRLSSASLAALVAFSWATLLKKGSLV